MLESIVDVNDKCPNRMMTGVSQIRAATDIGFLRAPLVTTVPTDLGPLQSSSVRPPIGNVSTPDLCESTDSRVIMSAGPCDIHFQKGLEGGNSKLR